jgi:hypothetical protein
VRGWIDRPAPDRSVDNDWKFQVTANPVLKAVDAAALFFAATPFGWPIFWIALAAGLMTLAPRLPSRDLLAPLLLSSILYGLGYGAVSVSSEFRHHLWTMLACLVAACVAMADLASSRAQFVRRDYLIASAPAVLVVVLSAAWRVWPA